jgi:cell division transport system ATP-binding protein
MQIRFVSVTVEYTGIPALNNVTFEYDGKGVLMLTGATGAGKTTLLRLMYADVLPSSGEVTIDGKPTAKMRSKERREVRRKLGIVQQDCKLVSDYTVFENVLMPFAMRGFARNDANAAALELLADLGISYVRNKMPRQLSGGERHLVALARALAMEPKVIIADEPTGTLDEGTAKTVAAALQQAVDKGIGLVVSTHSQSFVSAFPTARRFTLEEGVLQLSPVSSASPIDVVPPSPEAMI